MNKTLANHITFLVTLLLSFSLVVLAFVILSVKRHDLNLQFENDLELNTNLISTSVSEPLYTYNTIAIKSIVDSFLNSWEQTIQKVEVFDSTGELILTSEAKNFKQISKDNLVDKKSVIKYDDKEIGKIIISFSDAAIKTELRNWAIGIVVYTSGAIFVLYLFFMAAFQKLITRPLNKLIGEITKLSKNDYSAKVDGDFKFELGTIANDFNEAIENIKLRDKRINEYAESLEHMVLRRTRERDEQTAKAITAARLASVGEMSAGVAHEINNPLAVINAIAMQIQKRFEARGTDFKEEVDKMLKIKSMVLRIQKIIEGIKKFSRDGSHESMEFFDLPNFIESIKDLTNYKMISSSITFNIKNEANIKILHGQEIQLSQVIINLINNAVDAISDFQGDKFINFSIREVDNTIYFRVSDCGNGIPEEVQRKMLDPFFTTKAQGKGTGLGLSLSRDIVKNHGGDLYYVKEEKNTTFEFFIPIR